MLNNEIITGNGTPIWAMSIDEEEDYNGDWLNPDEKLELKKVLEEIKELDIPELNIEEEGD